MPGCIAPAGERPVPVKAVPAGRGGFEWGGDETWHWIVGSFTIGEGPRLWAVGHTWTS